MDYKIFVESLAKSGIDQVFFNSGPIHAAIVMSRIFKYSQEKVDIYCGGFTGTVSNDEQYLKHLSQFLERGGKLRVLAEKDLSKAGGNEIFRVLKKHRSSVEMRRAEIKVIFKSTNEPVHFAVGDDRMLRLETGTADYTAEVNFGDPQKAKSLENLFDRVWNESRNNLIDLNN